MPCFEYPSWFSVTYFLSALSERGTKNGVRRRRSERLDGMEVELPMPHYAWVGSTVAELTGIVRPLFAPPDNGLLRGRNNVYAVRRNLKFPAYRACALFLSQT